MKQHEAEKAIEKARKVYNNKPSMPAGYRLKVLSIPAEKGLEEAEGERYETLRQKGFEVKSDEQKRRESKGADRGILVEIGPGAWKGNHLVESAKSPIYLTLDNGDTVKIYPKDIKAIEEMSEGEPAVCNSVVHLYGGKEGWYSVRETLQAIEEKIEEQIPDWAQVGQVVLYLRYSGKEEEEPKGSGIMYRFINDEDVLGYYEEKVL